MKIDILLFFVFLISEVPVCAVFLFLLTQVALKEFQDFMECRFEVAVSGPLECLGRRTELGCVAGDRRQRRANGLLLCNGVICLGSLRVDARGYLA